MNNIYIGKPTAVESASGERVEYVFSSKNINEFLRISNGGQTTGWSWKDSVPGTILFQPRNLGIDDATAWIYLYLKYPMTSGKIDVEFSVERKADWVTTRVGKNVLTESIATGTYDIHHTFTEDELATGTEIYLKYQKDAGVSPPDEKVNVSITFNPLVKYIEYKELSRRIKSVYLGVGEVSEKVL